MSGLICTRSKPARAPRFTAECARSTHSARRGDPRRAQGLSREWCDRMHGHALASSTDRVRPCVPTQSSATPSASRSMLVARQSRPWTWSMRVRLPRSNQVTLATAAQRSPVFCGSQAPGTHAVRLWWLRMRSCVHRVRLGDWRSDEKDSLRLLANDCRRHLLCEWRICMWTGSGWLRCEAGDGCG